MSDDDVSRLMKKCMLCPRKCGADRLSGHIGYCGETAEIRAARAALHMWEEPCISGSNGSGAVFFSGCNMKCVFCQNHDIASSEIGRPISSERLSDIFLELQEKHANNINLVTPSHFVPQICKSLIRAKDNGLSIPVIYNTSSYECVETLRMLDGLIDVYLPDLKYFSSDLSRRYSNAPDYFPVASAAIAEMFRQVGTPVFENEVLYDGHPADSVYNLDHKNNDIHGETSSPENTDRCSESSDYDISESEIIKKGVIVRHLCLPGSTNDSKAVLKYLFDTYGNDIYVSIMSQYTPLEQMQSDPVLGRKLTDSEYNDVVDFCISVGMENAFIQDGETASESFIPAFDYKGLDQ